MLICLSFSLFFSVTDHAFADDPGRVQIDGIEFSLAAGLTLERAVPKSLVKWPVAVDWDCEGRLVVVEAGGAFKPSQVKTFLLIFMQFEAVRVCK